MKTKDEVLNQIYVNVDDLRILIPELNYYKALDIMNEIQDEMKEQNMFIPGTRKKLVSTKLLKKKLGI